MAGVGILTDASAYLLSANFLGAHRVHTYPLKVIRGGVEYTLPHPEFPARLPPTLLHQVPLQLIAPSEKLIRRRLQTLANQYDEVLILPMESTLSPMFARLLNIAGEIANRFPVYVMETHTFSVGLGWMVREGARLSAKGENLFSILSALRQAREKVFSMFCIKSLTYLHNAGVIGHAQAIVGEMLDLCPLFVLEEGRFVPVQKARSPRHMLDLMEEFAAEFGQVQEIGVVYGERQFARDARHLLARLRSIYPEAHYHYAKVDSVTAALLGPQVLGIFVLA